jgi:outer membrane protein TolC
MPLEGSPQAIDPAVNPVAVEQNSVIAQTQAQLRALQRSYFPRFSAQAAAYARGTGAANDGTRLGGFNGLAPNVQNYGIGLTVTFPLFELPSIRARQAERSAAIRAETARYQQIATELRGQWNRAVAALDGSRRVAANTPIQVSSARTTLDQANARYQAELATIDQVADAQRLVTQAEIDNALARLSVWRSLLSVAAAAGDLQPFLMEASQ